MRKSPLTSVVGEKKVFIGDKIWAGLWSKDKIFSSTFYFETFQIYRKTEKNDYSQYGSALIHPAALLMIILPH